MRHKFKPAILLLIAVVLLASIAIAQQVKKTVNATITAPTLEYDLDAGIAVFSGGTHVVLKGAYDADMKAQTVTVKLGGKPERVESVVAEGSVVLGMKSPEYDATMTAPKMTLKLPASPERLESVIADGPVGFTAVTTATETSSSRRIEGSAQQQATYNNSTKLVKLIGGAAADVTPLDGETAGDTINFEGETVTYNLGTKKLLVDNANLTIQTTPE